MILLYILFAITFLLGYYLGGKGKEVAVEIEQTISDIMRDKPKPGVVNHLNDEQILEKHDKTKRGNLDAFNRFFKEHPIIK